MDLLSLFAGTFEIPIIAENQKIWFFRTKAGHFYYDFQANNFIGLGWELVDAALIRDQKISAESKREKIEDLYPDEKRPGLILGQMETFYNKMQINDLVIIPSAGGKQIAIGKIGDFITQVTHKESGEEYAKCDYAHKRSVEWLKKVDAWQDIYLFKALRAQQTISDITEEAKLVFRNLFPVYIADDAIHISFQKESTTELSLADNVDLQFGLLEIMDETAKLYGMESFKHQANIKTAVGSPGFIEAILPGMPISAIAVAVIIRYVSGKVKSGDGSTATGIAAIITAVNTLINDYHNRKKTDAETKQIEASARLIEAQAQKETAEAEKIKAETALISAQTQKASVEALEERNKYEQIAFTSSGKTTVQVQEEQEQLTVASEADIQRSICKLEECGGRICAAAANCGMLYNGERIKKLG